MGLRERRVGGAGPHALSHILQRADLPIVTHEQYARSDDPVFEIVAGGRMLSYWVRLIITPRQAAVLLEARGSPPEAQRSNSHKRW